MQRETTPHASEKVLAQEEEYEFTTLKYNIDSDTQDEMCRCCFCSAMEWQDDVDLNVGDMNLGTLRMEVEADGHYLRS